MAPVTRRTLLVASGSAALLSALPILPAGAQAPAMPPVRFVQTNGIRLAVHDAGSGPAIVLLHGFPGLAYTWRHQIPALVSAGYRVIVPDLRGYGQSDAPAAIEAYDIQQLTADMTGLLDVSGVDKALFMGHDWGGMLAWQMPLIHPKRVAGVIGVNTPFMPHWTLWLHPDLVAAAQPERRGWVINPNVDPIVQMRQVYSPEMYVLMFEDGKRADTAMAQDIQGTLRNAYRKDLMTAAEWDALPPEVANMEYYGKPLPRQFPGHDVLTAAELDVYTAQFKRTGFTPAINWYRNISRNWQAGRTLEQTIRVPALMISAANDVVLRPGMAEGMETYIPDLEKKVIADCWHWTPEEKPAELNQLTLSWLSRRYPAG